MIKKMLKGEKKMKKILSTFFADNSKRKAEILIGEDSKEIFLHLFNDLGQHIKTEKYNSNEIQSVEFKAEDWVLKTTTELSSLDMIMVKTKNISLATDEINLKFYQRNKSLGLLLN
jgi:hypothetical protein